MDYEIVIGLEVHTQLKTASKLFCGCRTEFGAEPNTQVCPVCLGLPGVLPVLNKKAFEYALRAALSLNCQINPFTKFDRKNYFYPDLPKNYQISQYDLPFAHDGYLEIEVNSKTKRIAILRVHLEEDAGKLIHPLTGLEDSFQTHWEATDNKNQVSSLSVRDRLPMRARTQTGTQTGIKYQDRSLVDLNRTGIPLLEIVSKPEISSPEEAYQYLTTLKAILEYLEISDCDMEKGSLRCDANLSVRPKGEKALGIKTELKNLNSFKFIAKALAYEAGRQINLLKDGGQLVQETRLWDQENEVSRPMRSKEETQDYRYFPEPDLVPMRIDHTWLEEIKKTIPELPKMRKNRFVSQYQIPEYDADVLTQDKALADYFEEGIKYYQAPKSVSNWIMGEVLKTLKEKKWTIQEFPIRPDALVELLKRFDQKEITSTAAKEVFDKMFLTGKSASEIISTEGLAQVSDAGALEKIIDQVIQENPKIVSDYRSGKEPAIMALVGQVMRASRGKANPQIAKELLLKKLRF